MFDLSHFGLNKNALPDDWHEGRIDSIAEFNPQQIGRDYPYNIIEYLDIGNSEKGSITKLETYYINEAPSRAKRIAKTNDTIISTVRPGNRAFAFIQGMPKNLIVSTGYVVLRPRGCVPRFMYYLSTSDPIINYLASIAEEKTAYPSVTPKDIAECVVPIPPIIEQKAIAHILGALDDRIELNRRMNKTLELIARAIFKSWFVDFDPVRAKMEGRQPAGMDAETAALFPDSFEDSPLGKIPKGWEVCKLSDLCLTQYGYTASAKAEPIGPRFLRVKDMNKLDWIEWDMVPFCEIDEKNRQKYILNPGDIVVARMADPGKVAIIDDSVDAVFGSYLVRLKTHNAKDAYYVYYFLKSPIYEEYKSAVKGGSVQANINAKTIVDVLMANPPDFLKEKFSTIAALLRRSIAYNVKQSSLLSNMRDTLLPKLISGQIRVKDAEKFVEEFCEQP